MQRRLVIIVALGLCVLAVPALMLYAQSQFLVVYSVPLVAQVTSGQTVGIGYIFQNNGTQTRSCQILNVRSVPAGGLTIVSQDTFIAPAGISSTLIFTTTAPIIAHAQSYTTSFEYMCAPAGSEPEEDGFPSGMVAVVPHSIYLPLTTRAGIVSDEPTPLPTGAALPTSIPTPTSTPTPPPCLAENIRVQHVSEYPSSDTTKHIVGEIMNTCTVPVYGVTFSISGVGTKSPALQHIDPGEAVPFSVSVSADTQNYTFQIETFTTTPISAPATKGYAPYTLLNLQEADFNGYVQTRGTLRNDQSYPLMDYTIAVTFYDAVGNVTDVDVIGSDSTFKPAQPGTMYDFVGAGTDRQNFMYSRVVIHAEGTYTVAP